MPIKRFCLVCLALMAVMALTACAGAGSRKSPSVTVTSEAFDVFSGDFENTAAIKRNLPRSVAVLPFSGDPADWSGVEPDEDPVLVVRRGFYNHLSSLPFQDLELAEVDARLADAAWTRPRPRPCWPRTRASWAASWAWTPWSWAG